MPSRLLWEHFEFLSTPSARRATGFGAQTPSGGYDFYPRPPRGGRQDSETNGFRIIKFLSTPSARRATRTRRQMVSGSSNFYPRPPRGGRPGLGDKWFQDHQISIHALREEGDPDAPRLTEMRKLFLSTPSARRATFLEGQSSSPLSISIHALREEGDPPARRWWRCRGYFYPRPPRGGRRA